MMLACVVLLSIISFVFASEGGEHQRQCDSSTMKLVLKSHYNETGSWQSQVVFKQQEQSSLDEDTPNQWVMDVHQTSSVCDEGKSTLETTIYLAAPVLKTVELPRAVPVVTHEDRPTTPATPSQTPPELSTQSLPPGYQLYPGVGYYKFRRDVTTWPAAQEICAQEGGHLVIINSQAEREVVRQLFAVLNPITPGASNQGQIHAGLQRTSNGKFATICGVPIEKTGFAEWYPGQPSSGANEPCGSIMRENISYNDISCSKQILPFICEIEL